MQNERYTVDACQIVVEKQTIHVGISKNIKNQIRQNTSKCVLYVSVERPIILGTFYVDRSR